MTSGGMPAGGVAGEGRSAENRLATKEKIYKALFDATWRTDDRQDGKAVRMLSYKPRKEDDDPSVGDTLTEQYSSNADIYTSGRWAAKRAHDLFRAAIDNFDLFKALQLPENDGSIEAMAAAADGKTLPPAFDKFKIVIVGSSVVGLTFHGTLIHLFREWQKTTGEPFGLSDVFEIQFLDSHWRPLQRLRQARDRRIVPRFEYERLLDLKEGAALPERMLSSKVTKLNTVEDVKEFYDRWNEFETVADASAINANTNDLKVSFMPQGLCWEAGSVRNVADQIYDGYIETVGDETQHLRFEIPKNTKPTSTTGGPLFRKGAYRPLSDGMATRIGLWTAETMDEDLPNFSCDMVLLATGPGIDISPSGPAEGAPTKDRWHENNQASYWNTPKVELDVVESDLNSVLILGHSDSAAGTVYSNILNDPEACSYRFLTKLLSDGPDYKDWFERLKTAVRAYVKDHRNPNETVTSTWQRALKSEGVQNVLFDAPVEKKYESYAYGDMTVEKLGPPDRPLALRKLLRSNVKISLAFHTRDGRKFTFKDGKGEPPIFLDCRAAGYDWPNSLELRATLFEGAWPENRIIMALLSPQIDVFQENGDEHKNLIVPKAVGKAKKTVTLQGGAKADEFYYSVPLYQVKVTYMDPDTDEDTYERDVVFKYVLDCRGAKFGTKYGNIQCYKPSVAA